MKLIAFPTDGPLDTLRVGLEVPPPPATGQTENIYFGFWHPVRSVDVEILHASHAEDFAIENGRNWSICWGVSPFHGCRGGPVHIDRLAKLCVAFRGYVVDPPVHSYSSSNEVLDYWRSPARRHNGVFSTAIIDESKGSVSLIADAMGFGPLYYRIWQGGLLFSSNPRFLAAPGDRPDLLAWRCRIQTGFIASDRSLSAGVSRLPAGKMIVGDRSGVRLLDWFDFNSMPEGRRRVRQASFREVEDQFQVAMTRCLEVTNGRKVLPLSSGHDSRRLLASMIDRGDDFQALTVRVFQKEYRDLDATFASAMASDFRFPHEVIEPADIAQYTEDDRNRRLLTDSETPAHTWALRLFDGLPDEPTTIFDGILGDILGNPGFRMAGMYKSPQADVEMILDTSITDAYDTFLNQGHWPSATQVREDIAFYLAQFGNRYNIAEIAFILLRQRRLTSPWSQQMVPCGHIVVCPYLDLDYISLLLEFDPKDKHRAIFQRECLKRFWPEFATYPGNRDIPNDVPAGTSYGSIQREIACLRNLFKELKAGGNLTDAFRLLQKRKVFLLMLARYGVAKAIVAGWGGYDVLELAARQTNLSKGWILRSTKDE